MRVVFGGGAEEVVDDQGDEQRGRGGDWDQVPNLGLGGNKVRKGGEKQIKRYFLDTFYVTMPMFAVRRRIHQYCRYYNGNFLQDHNKAPFPKVFLVCPTLRVQKSLLHSIPKILDEEDVDISFFLSFKDDIQKRGIQADSWEAVSIIS